MVAVNCLIEKLSREGQIERKDANRLRLIMKNLTIENEGVGSISDEMIHPRFVMISTV